MPKPMQNRIPHYWTPRAIIKQINLLLDLFPTDLTSPVPYTSPVRNLGVIFDKNLTFGDHISTSPSYLGGGLGGVVVIDAAFGAHGKSRPRFKPGTLLHRCSDLGQVVNLSFSVA